MTQGGNIYGASMEPERAAHGPLLGVRVIDLAHVLAGPYASMMLGDLGAEVISVERPGSGDVTRSWGPLLSKDVSSYFAAANRNKRSIALDLKSGADQAVLRKLVSECDVVIENHRPGAMESLGFGYDDICAVNERVVYCSISGFGSEGYQALPGYDLIIQAVSGFMSITGEEGSQHTKVGVAVGDVLAALFAVGGITSALYERHTSGRGQKVELDLMSCALAGLVNQASTFLTTGEIPVAMGNRHPTITPYEVFETSSRPIAVAAGTDRQFHQLCLAVGCDELIMDGRFGDTRSRVRNYDVLALRLGAVFKRKGAEYWVRRLTEYDIPCGPVNDIAEAFDYAKGLGLSPVVEVGADRACAAGRQVASPLRFSRTPVQYRLLPPELDADGSEVRKEIGLEELGR